MNFYHRAPRPPLDAVIESIWAVRDSPRPHGLERVLPTGAAQLIVNLKEDRTRVYDPERPDQCISTSGTILAGVQTRYQIIDTSEQEYVAGVAFRPGGTAAFIRAPAPQQLLECETPDTELDAIESALREMFVPAAVHPAVGVALTAFDRVPLTASIGAVTSAIGISAKQFIEQFKRAVGVTPKRYCRIRRFQKALRLANQGRDVDWVQVALDCGYFDQAHFIHDFRSFAGITPTRYQAARTPFQNHVKFLQSTGDGI